MDTLIGILLLAMFAIVAWCVASEGAMGAVYSFFCVLFGGLLAMNFFELVAPRLEKISRGFAPFADFVALVGLFSLFVFLLRLGAEHFAPTQIELDSRLHEIIRWPWSLATGYLTMAILLTSLHTAPLPREFWGFQPEARNFLDISAPDRQWLGFNQWVSEHVLWNGRIFDGPMAEVEGTRQNVWPSFPIRYATRRASYASGNKSKSAPPPAPLTPPGSESASPGGSF